LEGSKMEKPFRKTGKVINVPLYDSLNGVLYNVPEKLGQLQKILTLQRHMIFNLMFFAFCAQGMRGDFSFESN